MTQRLNTKIPAMGAEFLVLGYLMIDGIQAYKTYDNHPGYDVVAVNQQQYKIARIQIKSRYATDHDGGFLIKNFDCDFVVFVALNRGYRYRKSKRGDKINESGIKEPELYVFPIAEIIKASRHQSVWNKVFIKDIPNSLDYRASLYLINDFMAS